MSVKLTGAWEKVVSTLKSWRLSVVGPAQSDLEELGNRIVDEVTENMLASPPPKLAKSTIARKRRSGAPFPTKSWFETGWLINNGFELVTKKGRFGRASVIVLLSDEIHPVDENDPTRGGVPAFEIFNKLEKGDAEAKIPARPVFEPVLLKIRAGQFPAMNDYQRKLLAKLKVRLR